MGGRESLILREA